MSSRASNIRALDGIRGLAIIFVLFHHFETLIPGSNGVLYAAKAVFSFGWAGVDLFFALSGFLITGILLDTRDANNYFSAFYARRILRIFPLYYSVLTVVLIAAALVHPRPTNIPLVADQKLYYLYLTNWLALWKGPWRSNILGHFWSLAVEEQFYLVWPLCVWLMVRRNVAKLAVGGSAIALFVRIFWVAHGGPSQAIVMATVTRMDSLLCGALGAILFRDDRVLNALRKWLPWAASLALLSFAVPAGWLRVLHGSRGELFFVETIGFSLLALGFSCVIVYAAASDGAATFMQHLLRSRVLTDFGKYSYGIYVYHVPILGAFAFVIHKGPLKSFVGEFWFGALCVALSFAVSFYVAKISYEYFERRFLALKQYFEARRSVPPAMDEVQIGAEFGGIEPKTHCRFLYRKRIRGKMKISSQVVIFGAGSLGRRVAQAVHPVLFCDNNPAMWSTVCEGVPVESPETAIERHPDATFIAAIWHPSRTERMIDRINQLKSLGASNVIPFSGLFAEYGNFLLPHWFWERPDYYAAHDDEIRRVRTLMDPEGKQEFDRQVQLRLGNVSDQVIDSGTQYFPHDVFKLSLNEVFIDCGAYDGDTITEFRRASGDQFARIIAFEPDPKNFEALKSSLNGDPRITLQPYATGIRRETVRFTLSGTASRISSSGACEVQVTTLDEALDGVAPTYMKFDIEGSEPDALEGGRKTITQHRPKVAACLYHAPDHLWTIPLLLNELLPDSRFTMRTYVADGWECVCYCIPN